MYDSHMIDSAIVVTSSHPAPRILDRHSRLASEVIGFSPRLLRNIADQSIVGVLVEGTPPSRGPVFINCTFTSPLTLGNHRLSPAERTIQKFHSAHAGRYDKVFG